MPAQTVNYQCPACMGPLHFSGEAGKLQCDYCGSQYDPAEIEKLYDKKEEAAEAAFQKAEGETASQRAETETEAEPKKKTKTKAKKEPSWTPEGMRAYSCPSCGAEVVCDETTVATSCPYCGNPTVVPGQVGGMLKPDYIIPFKLDKAAAVSALKKYYKGKKLLPRAFSQENHVTELQGVYVPFWLFDAKVAGRITMKARNTRTWTEGDYEVTETDHYAVARAGDAAFQRVPVDGSKKMPDSHMDSIEPFDYGEMKEFSTAYLPGFLAEKYDVSAKASRARATKRMKNTLTEMLDASVQGYSSTSSRTSQMDTSDETSHYAMLPVWMLHTKWQDKDYLFAMNGQTGKLIGDLPVSKGKFAAWMAGISLPLMALTTGLMYLLCR